MCPKIAIRTEDRIRIELEYTDYKEWKRILGDHAEIWAKEHSKSHGI